MTALLCSRSLKTLQPPLITGTRFYHVGKASSVRTAIAKALRKSHGKAFDGKPNPDPKDPREIYKARHGLPEYKPRRPRPEVKEAFALKGSLRLAQELENRGFEDDDLSWSSSKPDFSSFKKRGRVDRTLRHSGGVGRGARDSRDSRSTHRQFGERSLNGSGRRRDENEKSGGQDFEAYSNPRREESNEITSKPKKDSPLAIKKVADKGIPLSVPYTTPASEFLYGSSVVEAALKSRRQPGRQLYKLYIYTGENRLSTEQDEEFERIAKQQNIPVQHVGSSWQRLLSKMSAGRPHNGYILEASPLPRVPVTKLGAFTSSSSPEEGEEQDGFAITLDYQSKEEAAVNGTTEFIRVPTNVYGRKPLILFLDSIQDPQNLGGIIRTASFLGVSCICLASRNCAPFSPVVLKASAGAVENMTILSVKNPESFIQSSRAAGWKIYAAVPPSTDPHSPPIYNHNTHVKIPSLSTDQLLDPLTEAPSILMLGSEGEGLRKNLRYHADMEVYIRGSGRRYGVDSLNVNVATGVLCNAFIKRGKVEEALKAERRKIEEERRRVEEERREVEREKEKEVPMMGDLF